MKLEDLVLVSVDDQGRAVQSMRSLTYLQSKVVDLPTPRSLGWSLLGLGAWRARLESSHASIDACLKNQARYGGYDTSSLSLLLVALKSPGGLGEIFSDPGKS